MNELIKITQQGDKNIMAARELYAFLEVKERFSKFMNRMLKYGFIEGVDYTPYQMVHPQNRADNQDYALTIDCGKEIAMLSRSPKGKEARLYFIECENRLKKGAVKLPSTKELAKMVLQAEEEKERLQIEITNANERLKLQESTINDLIPAAQYNSPKPEKQFWQRWTEKNL